MNIDWTLWITVAVIQCVLSVIATRSRNRSTWLARYIFFATTQTFILMGVAAILRAPRLYLAAYSVGSVVGTSLAIAVIASAWRTVFGPDMALPLGTLTRFRILVLSIIIPLCAVLIGFFRARTPREYLNAVINLESVVLSATSVTMVLMIIYSGHLGISWRSKPARTVGGFLWCFGTNWLVVFIAGREFVSISTAQRMGQVAYLMSLMLWGHVLLDKERAPKALTGADLLEIQRQFGIHGIFVAGMRERSTRT
jgi:hypothetical protein